ncbi:MAG: Ig-like domain-containing protein [Anaerolineaceae bacterium]
MTISAAGDPPVITLAGVISDNGSGISSNGLSLDGGNTWAPVNVGLGGAWLYSWNTAVLPDGNNALQLRAIDHSGRSTVTSLSFTVANYPAQVTLADPWTLPSSGALQVVEGGIAYNTVTVTICDPQGRAACIVRNYSPSEVPSTIKWDGWFGSYEAPPGDYTVTVKVFDNIDRVVIAESAIIVPESQSSFKYFEVVPVSTATPMPDDEGELTRFFGFVNFFDGAKLNVDSKEYTVTTESILDDGNGELKTGALVSGTAMSLTNRVVSVKTLSAQLAEGDGIVTFQGVIDYWSDPDDVGDSWLIINDLAYHLTPATAIHGEAAEGSYVVGILENGLVVNMWVSTPDSANALVEFKGTVSEIIGSVDQLPYSVTVGGLNYQVNNESVVSGDPVSVGTYVTGTAMGADRLVLGMQVTTKKPGLWSLALDFIKSSTGGLVTGGVVAAVLLTGTGLIVLNKRKAKKAEEQAVDDAVEKLSK